MIIDASVIIDAVADPGGRGDAARAALGAQPSTEVLSSPGHLAFEVLSGLRAAAHRPGHPLGEDDVAEALAAAEGLEIEIEATPWADVRRAWELSLSSLRFADALYVAAAERHRTGLLTADGRIERSGTPMRCPIVTVEPS
ncbi:MAG TPA: type II toxin-antitoxin system VapC family toxin [Acidimicrobiales bacterium]|nr:type II toxin-antitoxin system VapC family toxin [Acidimicrobiales bacterium]